MIKFSPFSRKQLDLLTWWVDESPKKDCEGIIADGAIRSGKTVAMALSFLMWSMTRFSGENFGLCGKTIGSLRRNVIKPLKEMALTRGYKVIEHRADNCLSISRNGKTNDYYLFGGRDERSQDLIQGVTLAGCLFDEVALMPYSFVNQATARCSVEGSKLWFNCNPGSPMHWFKVEYIDRADLLGYIYLHFTMDDNTSLSEKIKERYRRQYVGVFFQRYILGLWTIAEGLIYPMFDDGNMYDDADRPASLYNAAHRTIACDYGTTNPCVFLDIWDDGQTVWVDNEYRWDSKSDEARNSGIPNKTDAQYADAMETFMGNDPARQCMVLVDPSALSFITELRQRGFWVKAADNEVLDGIRKVASLVGRKKIMVHRRCRGLIAEFQSYAWDEKASLRGEEKPLKVLDHGVDGVRYFCLSLPDWRYSAL